VASGNSVIMAEVQTNSGNRVERSFIPRTVFSLQLIISIGPGSSVSIVTRYGLEGPWIESRCGARFSAPIQTGSGAHPASCTMGTGSFPGVKAVRA
jgi:hypothetical protein